MRKGRGAQSPATMLENPANSAGTLGSVLLNSFLLFSLMQVQAVLQMSHNPSASRLFLLWHWELQVLLLPALPLHPVRRKLQSCWKLFKFVWIKDICFSALRIHMCTQVKIGDLKLLWSATAMSKKCMCMLLGVLESSAVDPHRCACKMDFTHCVPTRCHTICITGTSESSP